jgi:flagellar hook-associated protein 3 FlgL
MDRALTLAAQGANSLQTAELRAGIALEIRAIHDQVTACSATTVQGRPVFSGEANRVEHPGGESFAAAMNAPQIFDPRNADGTPAAENVLAALDNLRLALESNDADAVAAAAEPLKQASAHLNSAEAFYGSVQSRIRDAVDFAKSNDIRLRADISAIEDADVAAAALTLASGQTQLQAALQMRAALPRSTLFDYLG